MILKRRYLMFFLLINFAFYACEKDQNELINDNTSQPQPQFSHGGGPVNNGGVLEFADTAEFIHTMDSLVNQDETVLDNWEQSLNFTSMRTYWIQKHNSWHDGMQSSDPEDTSDIWVEDIFFATVLNPNGKVKIGDTTYQLLRDEKKAFANGNLIYTKPFSKSIRTSTDTINESGTGGEVSTNSFSQGCNWANTFNVNHWEFVRGYNYDWKPGIGLVRIKGKTWNVGYWWWYSSTGVKTKYQKHITITLFGQTFGQWKNTQAPFLRATWDCYFKSWFSVFWSNRCGAKDTWNKKRSTKTVYWESSPAIDVNGEFESEYNNPPYWNDLQRITMTLP